MKLFFASILLLLFFTGCCRIAEKPFWPAMSTAVPEKALYRFRLERSGTTKLSGLLVLKKQENGIWSGLLDATGIPLVKTLVKPDGSKQIEYCAVTVCDTALPELLGKLVDYIYFTPAKADCPWYAFSSVCEEYGSEEHSIKWKRFGPFHSWEVEHLTPPEKNEKIDVRMYFSSVQVHLQRIETPRRERIE